MKLSKIKWGRRYEYDKRNRKFPITAAIPMEVKPRSYTWACTTYLDQGSAPACVGFSCCHEAVARPVVVKGLTNKDGLAMYKLAQKLDQYPDIVPYDGSSILGGAKAMAQKGYLKEYRWAFDESTLCLAIGVHGPAVIGINWYTDMMEPGSKGRIKIGGQVEGGHAILVRGVSLKNGLYRLKNSWSREWGLDGDCFISREDMARLLGEEGDAMIPVVRLYG